MVFYFLLRQEREGFQRISDKRRMVEILIFRHLVTFGQRAGIAAYRVQQFLYGLLDEDASVIHDDAVVYQPFHILNDVRGQENSFVFRAGIVTQIVHEETAVARDPDRERNRPVPAILGFVPG